MISFTPNLKNDSSETLYKQLYLYLIDEISAGRLKEGERLPSKKALASHLHISVNTIETAYSMLVQEGYVFSKPRSGYYICKIDAGFIRSKKIVIAGNDEPKPQEYKFDFKTNAVDIKSFPYSTWVKLSKEVMYGNPELLLAGESKGDSSLRYSIAKHLHELRGVNCSPSQIVVGAGIEYLMMLLTEILGKNNIYAIENPGYKKIDMILKNSSADVRYVPLDNDGMIIESLKQTDANIVYITPSHQFPTGAVMPVWRRQELLAWANKDDKRFIIEDDYNSEFHFSGKPIPSVQGFDTNGRVIYLGTFSRILAPSIRIAYMVLPDSLLKVYEERFSGYSSSVPRFEQHALSEFISGGYLGRHINRVKNIYRKRRDALMRELIKRPEKMKITGERAGLHLLVTPESFAKSELLERAKRNRIRIYQMSQYYFTEQSVLDNTIILGYAGIKTEQVGEAVRLLFED